MTLNKPSTFQNSDTYRNVIHNLIPGGAHTYSKGDDAFSAIVPAAIESGKGAWVNDLDGNTFLDCSMGLTSVGLGHAWDPVDERVIAALRKGVNFQRPSFLEREVAEKFLQLVPGHQMIKFAKNGSVVTTAAVKLARAFTGRTLVAFPHDQPFFSYDDWFIGKTPCNKGVPDEISALSVTYHSHDLNSLETLFQQHPGKIACVISQPETPEFSPTDYLDNLIAITHKYGALFIQDEMITGFKTDLPGSISKYKVSPDMATWGKGIANGYSFCALTGKKEIMELGGITRKGEEKVFLISTTHGGETTALAAASATIDQYIDLGVVEKNHHTGKTLIGILNRLIKTECMEEYISIIPCPWMIVFVCKDQSKSPSAGLRTLLIQELVKNGVLFQGIFVPCYSHGENEIQYFTEAFGEALKIYKLALESSYADFLTGEPALPVFRKYL